MMPVQSCEIWLTLAIMNTDILIMLSVKNGGGNMQCKRTTDTFAASNKFNLRLCLTEMDSEPTSSEPQLGLVGFPSWC